MRRRYTSVRNAIDALRARWGLGDTEQAQSVPTGEGPSVGVHPLPLTAPQSPEPYFRPLPAIDRSVLDVGRQPSDSGTVDYEARQASQLDSVPRGDVGEPVTVYPAWESRLEGMRDFLGHAITDLSGEGGLVTPGSFTVDVFSCPQGFTTFLKRFRYTWLDPLPANLDESNCLATLLVDGVVVPDYFNLPLGPLLTDYEDTFVIAQSGQRLQLRIDVTENIGVIAVLMVTLFYGNVRPRTGEAIKADVGIRPPSPPPPVVVQPPAPVRAPPPPPPPTWPPNILHGARSPAPPRRKR